MRLRADHEDRNPGCAYLLGENAERRRCDAPRRPGSPYCLDHHSLCHVRCGTTEEGERLREVEALANAVGGRKGGNASGPSRRFLRRLEHALRDF